MQETYDVNQEVIKRQIEQNKGNMYPQEEQNIHEDSISFVRKKCHRKVI